jgi:hypothetical protein
MPDDTFYYEGLFGDVYPMKKNSWSYKIYATVMIGCLIAVMICLLPYVLLFLFFVYAIILKLLGF